MGYFRQCVMRRGLMGVGGVGGYEVIHMTPPPGWDVFLTKVDQIFKEEEVLCGEVRSHHIT